MENALVCSTRTRSNSTIRSLPILDTFRPQRILRPDDDTYSSDDTRSPMETDSMSERASGKDLVLEKERENFLVCNTRIHLNCRTVLLVSILGMFHSRRTRLHDDDSSDLVRIRPRTETGLW